MNLYDPKKKQMKEIFLHLDQCMLNKALQEGDHLTMIDNFFKRPKAVIVAELSQYIGSSQGYGKDMCNKKPKSQTSCSSIMANQKQRNQPRRIQTRIKYQNSKRGKANDCLHYHQRPQINSTTPIEQKEDLQERCLKTWSQQMKLLLSMPNVDNYIAFFILKLSKCFHGISIKSIH